MNTGNQFQIPPIAKRLMILGKTQTELADELGLSPQSVSYYVNGHAMPAKKRMKKVALALEVPAEVLVEMLQQTRLMAS